MIGTGRSLVSGRSTSPASRTWPARRLCGSRTFWCTPSRLCLALAPPSQHAVLPPPVLFPAPLLFLSCRASVARVRRFRLHSSLCLCSPSPFFASSRSPALFLPGAANAKNCFPPARRRVPNAHRAKRWGQEARRRRRAPVRPPITLGLHFGVQDRGWGTHLGSTSTVLSPQRPPHNPTRGGPLEFICRSAELRGRRSTARAVREERHGPPEDAILPPAPRCRPTHRDHPIPATRTAGTYRLGRAVCTSPPWDIAWTRGSTTTPASFDGPSHAGACGVDERSKQNLVGGSETTSETPRTDRCFHLGRIAAVASHWRTKAEGARRSSTNTFSPVTRKTLARQPRRPRRDASLVH